MYHQKFKKNMSHILYSKSAFSVQLCIFNISIVNTEMNNSLPIRFSQSDNNNIQIQ